MMKTPTKASELLTLAKAKIANPAHWCKHHMAESERLPCDPMDQAADRWCAKGALLVIYGKDVTFAWNDPAHDTINRAFSWLAQASITFAADLKKAGFASIQEDAAVINDFGDHAMVMAMYQQAIDLAVVNED